MTQTRPPIDLDRQVTLDGLRRTLKVLAPVLSALVACVALPIGLSVAFGLDIDAMFWIVLGLFSGGIALFRPFLLWHHPKVVLVRSLLTDSGAICAYLLLAVFALSFGGRRQSMILRAKETCLADLAHATDAHERIRILYRDGATGLPSDGGAVRNISCQILLESR